METAAVAMALCCGLGRGDVHPSSDTEFPSSCVPHIFLHPAALCRVPCNLLLCYWGRPGPTLRTLFSERLSSPLGALALSLNHFSLVWHLMAVRRIWGCLWEGVPFSYSTPYTGLCGLCLRLPSHPSFTASLAFLMIPALQSCLTNTPILCALGPSLTMVWELLVTQSF